MTRLCGDIDPRKYISVLSPLLTFCTYIGAKGDRFCPFLDYNKLYNAMSPGGKCAVHDICDY